MPKRTPSPRKRERLVIEIVSETQKRAQPKGVGPPCIFCDTDTQGKVFAEGCVLDTREFPPVVVWRYRGVVHWSCAEKAEEEKKRELGIP